MDVTTIRSRNVAMLVQQCGGPTEFGRRVDRDQAQVSQWTSATNPKPIGGRLARYLEGRLGYERGWLDAPQWEGAPESHSQTVRLDRDIVDELARAMQDTASELRVTLTIRQTIDVFARMYDRIGESGITTADVVWMVKRLEQGTRQDAEAGDLSNGPRDVAGGMGRGKKT